MNNIHDNYHIMVYAYKHYFNTVEPIEFVSYEDLYNNFQKEWMEIAIKFKGNKL